MQQVKALAMEGRAGAKGVVPEGCLLPSLLTQNPKSKAMCMGSGVPLRLREDQAWATMGHPEPFDETCPA